MTENTGMEPQHIPDDRRAAELMSKYIRAKITEDEEIELNGWIIHEDNYFLFERLTSPANAAESARWFTQNGVSAKFLEKPFAIYESQSEKDTRHEFYYWSGLIAFIMAMYFFILRFA